MTIDEIKLKLVKQATAFRTGGFKPFKSITESWIGNVLLYREEEEIPLDADGELMIPLFQLCLDGLPYVPPILEGTKAITVFISKKLPMDITPNGANWLLREYKQSDKLVMKELSSPASPIKPFPLEPYLVQEDYPVWDGGGIPFELEQAILDLENSGELDDYYDETECCDEHKIGGYPCFCQPGVDFGEGFEFVFQIASDDKAKLNIIDSGTIFLAKNPQTNEWRYYCDFY